MNERYKGLGKRIENIRLQKGMNKSEFGKMFQTNGSLVNKWEKGKVTPNEERLKTIANLGNTTVDDLLKRNSLDDYTTAELLEEIKRRYEPLMEGD